MIGFEDYRDSQEVGRPAGSCPYTTSLETRSREACNVTYQSLLYHQTPVAVYWDNYLVTLRGVPIIQNNSV